jgi:hypothetical protein
VCESPIFVRISTRSQKQSLNNGFTKDDFRIIDKALQVSKTKRDKLKRDNKER